MDVAGAQEIHAIVLTNLPKECVNRLERWLLTGMVPVGEFCEHAPQLGSDEIPQAVQMDTIDSDGCRRVHQKLHHLIGLLLWSRGVVTSFRQPYLTREFAFTEDLADVAIRGIHRIEAGFSAVEDRIVVKRENIEVPG